MYIIHIYITNTFCTYVSAIVQHSYGLHNFLLHTVWRGSRVLFSGSRMRMSHIVKGPEVTGGEGHIPSSR